MTRKHIARHSPAPKCAKCGKLFRKPKSHKYPLCMDCRKEEKSPVSVLLFCACIWTVNAIIMLW